MLDEGFLEVKSSEGDIVKNSYPDTLYSHDFNGGKYFSGDISSILINQLTYDNAPLNTEKKRQLDEELVITKREKEILQLLLSGKGNKEIAEALEISKRTAEVHRFNLMKKLKVKNLIELANKAKEYSLL